MTAASTAVQVATQIAGSFPIVSIVTDRLEGGKRSDTEQKSSNRWRDRLITVVYRRSDVTDNTIGLVSKAPQNVEHDRKWMKNGVLRRNACKC